MRLHIMYNEKVIDRAIVFFETVFPDDNKYIVLCKEGEKKIVSQHQNVFFVSAHNKNLILFAIGNVSGYSHLIIHFLSVDIAKFLSDINHPSIYWVEWGADLYINLLELRGFKIYEDTKHLQRTRSKYLPLFAINISRFLLHYLRYIHLHKFIKKVKYFVPDSMPGEYELLLKYYPEFKHLEYKEFFYYPIDVVINDQLRLERTTGKNIVVNHSCSLSGNHSGVFQKLSTLDLGERKVIVPLSYGSKENKKFVLSEGERLIQKNFVPLLEFMSLNEYNKILLSANVFIYGHWRQEAVGNILVALYLGGKVFLNKRNPLFGFYKSLGLILFEIEELTDQMLNFDLDDKSVNINRRILEVQYSKRRLLLLIKQNFA